VSLRFRSVASIRPGRPVEWIWEDMLPRGYVSMLGAPGGTGKSALVAALEIAVVLGYEFLRLPTLQGPVLHIDFDSDDRAQMPWYERAGAGMGVSWDALGDLHYVDGEDAGLEPRGFEQIREAAAKIRPVLVVVDAFTSAFTGVRANDAGDVNEVMADLRALARDLNAAVLVLDHTPKPLPNNPQGRGLLGSVMKGNGARAVFLLAKVPPSEVHGPGLLRLETFKNNLGPCAQPIGIQMVWNGDAVRYEVVDLPATGADAPQKLKAQQTVLHYLQARQCVVKRHELLKVAAARAGVGEITVKRAVEELLRQGVMTKVDLPGRGNPVAYALPGASEAGSQEHAREPGKEVQDP